MKLFLVLYFLFSSMLPLILFAQPKKGYEINGHIDGLKEGETIKMKLFYGFGLTDFKINDSGVVKNGQFHIAGYVPEGPRMYWLVFNQHSDHSCNLWIDNNQVINIIGSDIDKIASSTINEYIEIQGSPTQKGREAMVNMTRLYLQNNYVINREIKKVKDSVGFDRSLVEGLIKSKLLLDDRYYQVIMSYETPFTKPMLAFAMMDTWVNDDDGGHHEFYREIYDRLDSNAKNSFYGRKLKDIAVLSVGQPFPEFILPTSEGKPISLKGIVAKSKLTLVHFWGSDDFGSGLSETVKEVQQELRVLYKKYKNRGLNIIGVSADSVAKEWKLRIQAEEYPWINVSDLKGNLKGGIVNDIYFEGGHSAPNVTNVLIDMNGIIVAWDVSGVELQWYLWKYLGE